MMQQLSHYGALLRHDRSSLILFGFIFPWWSFIFTENWGKKKGKHISISIHIYLKFKKYFHTQICQNVLLIFFPPPFLCSARQSCVHRCFFYLHIFLPSCQIKCVETHSTARLYLTWLRLDGSFHSTRNTSLPCSNWLSPVLYLIARQQCANITAMTNNLPQITRL